MIYHTVSRLVRFVYYIYLLILLLFFFSNCVTFLLDTYCFLFGLYSSTAVVNIGKLVLDWRRSRTIM